MKRRTYHLLGDTRCLECMEEFEADPLAIEYRCPRCGAVFYPEENPLGTDLEDEI